MESWIGEGVQTSYPRTNPRGEVKYFVSIRGWRIDPAGGGGGRGRRSFRWIRRRWSLGWPASFTPTRLATHISPRDGMRRGRTRRDIALARILGRNGAPAMAAYLRHARACASFTSVFHADPIRPWPGVDWSGCSGDLAAPLVAETTDAPRACVAVAAWHAGAEGVLDACAEELSPLDAEAFPGLSGLALALKRASSWPGPAFACVPSSA
jgi:hypothetical protein